MQPDAETYTCLLGMLQRGITEARAMALTGDNKAASALLDALDNIPRYLDSWTERSEQEIESQLACFRDAFPAHCTDYLAVFQSRTPLL